MEHFMEQPFPMSWSEMGSLSKSPWGFSASNSGFASSTGCMDVLSTSPQLNNPVMVSSMPDSSAELQDSMHHAQGDAAAPYPYDDTITSSAIPPRLSPDTGPFSSTVGVSAGLSPVTNFRSHKELQEASQLRRMSEGVMNSAGGQINSLVANPSVSQAFTTVSQSPGLGISSRDGAASSVHNQSSSRAATTWCQSYLNGPRTLDGGKRKIEGFEGMAIDAGRMGNVCQDEATARGGTQDGLYSSSLAGAQGGQSQLGQAAGQLAQQQMQGSQGVFMPIYGTHTGVAQPQGAAAVVAGTARPRVRARRGQATDPHSIAERLRRERIAERMKALQELVPNSNKTDKASMLDEIIEYVKFLQLQVKVLSMSRLGPGTVAPLIADLPIEDGMVLAERQVARLMEEDMGSAMQFLQAKGLCLMPVSLANVISATSVRSLAVQQGLGAVSQSPLNASSTTTVGGASSSTIMSAATSSCAGGDGDSLTHG